jgi:hypothetical protein
VVDSQARCRTWAAGCDCRTPGQRDRSDSERGPTAKSKQVNLLYKLALDDCTQRLAEIDKVMALRHLAIDPNIVAPVKMYKAPRMFPHGTIARIMKRYVQEWPSRAN